VTFGQGGNGRIGERAARRRALRQRGFTLLELVMVMLLLCVAAAIAVPAMRGFGEGQRVRGCAAQLISLGQLARTQAVTRGVSYRLNVDPESATYWLTAERDGVFQTLGDDFGRIFTAPDGVTIECYAPPPADGRYPCVEFLPTGRTTAAASFVLTDTQGSMTEVACLSPAEPFRVRPVGELSVR
jgi:prepilin-type N-terminal cleavage/methylation domain-containing protein